MALYKTMELPNGVVLHYHRVCDIRSIVNQQIDIQVASYTSQKKREEEKKAYEENTGMDVYIEGLWFTKEYTDEGLSTVEAYEYLKTLPEFEGAVDIFEEADNN